MLGREAATPAELVFHTGSKGKTSPENYVGRLESELKNAYEAARKTLRSSQNLMKRHYDLQLLKRAYKVGDLVCVLDSARKKGIAKKLSPPWKGPGFIGKKITPYLYKVKTRKSADTVNHDRMKICVLDQITSWLETARRELSPEANSDGLNAGGTESGKNEVFCFCRKPNDGQLMIQCDECLDWFHGKCVGITEDRAQEIDTYLCPMCETSESLTSM